MARQFNGNVANFLEVADTPVLDLVGDMTYAVHLNLDAIGTFRTIASKGQQASPTAGYSFRLADTNVLQILKSNVALIASSSGTITDTTNWHHAAVRRSGDNYAFFIDGVAAGTASNSTAINATNQPLSIGRDLDTLDTGSFAFNGSLSDLSIWDIALSDSEIAQLSTGICAMQVQWPFLVGYWPLKGVESPEPDFSRNYNSASLQGTVPAASHPAVSCEPGQSVIATALAGHRSNR